MDLNIKTNNAQLISPANRVNFKGNFQQSPSLKKAKTSELAMDSFSLSSIPQQNTSASKVSFKGLNTNKLAKTVIETGTEKLAGSDSKDTSLLKGLLGKMKIKSLLKSKKGESQNKKTGIIPLKTDPVTASATEMSFKVAGETINTTPSTKEETIKKLNEIIRNPNKKYTQQEVGEASAAKAEVEKLNPYLKDTPPANPPAPTENYPNGNSKNPGFHGRDSDADIDSNHSGLLRSLSDNSEEITDAVGDVIPFVQIASSGAKLYKAGKHVADKEYGKAAEVGADATAGAASGSAGALAGLKTGAIMGGSIGGPPGAVVGGILGAIGGGVAGRQGYNAVKKAVKDDDCIVM